MTSVPDLFSLLALFIQMAGFPTFLAHTEAIIAKLNHQLADKDMASMGLISAGPFTMGREGANPDEQPIHTVSLAAFYIDKYEVTVADYAKFLKRQAADPPLLWREARGDEHQDKPVLGVDWYDAVEYCRWSNKRLPTEAEWEKAARSVDGRSYPWGNDPPTDIHANFGHETAKGYAAVVKVGSFEKGQSPYGIYDLSGNVWEWVADRYDEHYYEHSPERNPRGPTTGPLRVVRGGAWNSSPSIIAAANRTANVPSIRRSDVGFRCAKDAPGILP
jgi:formylglycine-generating enzyme